MKFFQLHRTEDESGVSGTGIVAEGVIFSNGKCALSWLTEFTSLAVYDNMKTLEAIHGHGGKTKVVMLAEVMSPGGRKMRCDGKGEVWLCAPCHPATVHPDGVHSHRCTGCLACTH